MEEQTSCRANAHGAKRERILLAAKPVCPVPQLRSRWRHQYVQAFKVTGLVWRVLRLERAKLCVGQSHAGIVAKSGGIEAELFQQIARLPKVSREQWRTNMLF
jgi:hypothetical protein